jgi:Mg2+-importing ATPase
LLSFVFRDHVDALIILAILLVSGLLGFWQEYGASNAVARLLAMVQVKATVCRQGTIQEIPVEEIVRGCGSSSRPGMSFRGQLAY